MADTTTLIVTGVLVFFVIMVGAVLLYRCVCASKSSQEDGEKLSLLNPQQQSAAAVGGATTSGGSNHSSRSSSVAVPTAMPRGKYRVERKLGDGTYGVVFLAVRNADDARVAVKVITCNDAKTFEEAMNEFKLCQQLQGHPNVVQQLDLFEDVPKGKPARFGAVQLKDLGVSVQGGFAKALCIVTEYYPDGTLFDLLARRNSGLPEETVWRFTAELLSALAHFHRSNIIHRDIKPSNILIGKGPQGTQRCVLTDFGLSREFEQDQYVHTKIGTFHYMAPEQVQRRYTAKVDVWGVGCMIHAMCTAKVAAKDAPVMFEHRKKPAFEEQFRRDATSRGYSEDLTSFALTLLTENASLRPSAEEALETLERIRAKRQSAA